MGAAPICSQRLQVLKTIGIHVWQRRGGAAVAENPPSPPPTVAENLATATQAMSSPAAEIGLTAASESPPTAPLPTESLQIVEQEVAQCEKCELHQSRTNTVFGVGSPNADWMFVGEAPGQNEDLRGQPFVGRAGQLLDLMLAALGLAREQVFIANVLKCRPPNNRDPKPAEIAQCEPYLHRQLALIQPKVIVSLGRISAQALLKSEQPLGKLRGQVFEYGTAKTPLVVTYHPAYLLRSPSQKASSWEDLWRAKCIVSAAQ